MLQRTMWGEQDSNLRRLSQQIYSLPRLTASVSPRLFNFTKNDPLFSVHKMTRIFKGMQNYTLFSIIQIITENCILFFDRTQKLQIESYSEPLEFTVIYNNR